MARVVVIGAGVAGLLAATRLAQGGARVVLVSKGTGGLQLSQGSVDILGSRKDKLTITYAVIGKGVALVVVT